MDNFIWILLVVLLFIINLSYSAGVRHEWARQTGDQCFPYDIPIQRLNMDAGAWVNVFLDIPIECDQRVRGWQYHTTSLGIFYAGIWRPTRGGTHLQLVGKNRISPRNDGTGTVTMVEDQRLTARAGDLIGLHYPGNPEDDDPGLIPYEDSRRSLCCGLHRSDLSRIHNSWHRDGDLPEGTELEVNTVPGVTRLPALKPILEEVPSTPSPPPTSTLPANCGRQAIQPSGVNRIVGGRPVIPHSWPWVVSLQRTSGSHHCGGAVINEYYILTAGHCAKGWWDAEDPEDRPVILGIHDLDNPTEAHQIRYAAEVIVHVGYDYASHHHDIAMLRVTEPIVFTREVQPICLQGPEDDFLEEGNTCYVAGWGAEYFEGAGSSVLLQTDAPVISRRTCNRPSWYGGSISPAMVCAGHESGERDSCYGDSGGPLMYLNQGAWFAVGVVSWGEDCGVPRHPGVYARVDFYLEWILGVLEGGNRS